MMIEMEFIVSNNVANHGSSALICALNEMWLLANHILDLDMYVCVHSCVFPYIFFNNLCFLSLSTVGIVMPQGERFCFFSFSNKFCTSGAVSYCLICLTFSFSVLSNTVHILYENGSDYILFRSSLIWQCCLLMLEWSGVSHTSKYSEATETWRRRQLICFWKCWGMLLYVNFLEANFVT